VESNPVLRPFEQHGVDFSDTSGTQAIATCPFTDKPRKFYVNSRTGLWDSKTAGLSGNTLKFLELKAEQNEEEMQDVDLKALVRDRKLPRLAFQDIGLGFDGLNYTLPIRDREGALENVRLFRLGKRLYHTKGFSPGLWGAEALAGSPGTVYICEGEWDAIALRWLLDKLDKHDAVVAAPGASAFKKAWGPWFKGWDVVVLYDHDGPGEQGEEFFRKRVGSYPKRIRYTHWPDELPEGFDVRDWVIKGAIERGNPAKCFKVMKSLLQDGTRIGQREAVEDKKVRPKGKRRKVKLAKWEDVETAFRKWLHMPDINAVKISLATIISNQIEGDPVWMFLVAPPGGCKTELINAASGAAKTYMISSLTTHSLISGATAPGGQDPSLMAKLDGLTLLIKDMTSIVSCQDAVVDELFGILRDAYDGHCGKYFGTGIERVYDARFSILAGTTPAIYEVTERHKSLGERFLKFCIGDFIQHTGERDIILRAMGNVGSSVSMREELKDVCGRFLAKAIPEELPTMSTEMAVRISALAMFGSRLRGSVSRDKYRNELMLNKPFSEVGGRLGIQLKKLGQSLAILEGKTSVGEPEYALLKKTVLDTVPQREETMVRTLWTECDDIDDDVKTNAIAAKTRFPPTTVSRVLGDLNSLQVVQRGGKGNSFRWTLGAYMRTCCEESGIYDNAAERKRNAIVRIRRRRKT